MSGRGLFVNLIKEICLEHGIDCQSFSQDWILKLEEIHSDSDKKLSYIFGYNFSINGSAESEICKEKPATSDVLRLHKVPHIEHRVFLNPTSPLSGCYVGPEGVFGSIMEFASIHAFDVVVKPLKGTGGVNVVRAKNKKQIEVAVLDEISREYGVAISPYIPLNDEYRVVCLMGRVRLIYRKRRTVVEGDGKRCLKTLLIDYMLTLSDPRGVAKCLGQMTKVEMDTVLQEGETRPIQWKHNLGLGLSEVDLEIEDCLKIKLSDLALKAVRATGIKFCSVDIAESAVTGELLVVEINAGVMMDNFILDVERRALSKEIYTDAILASFT